MPEPRFNAVKHGCTARTPVLPGENESLWQEVEHDWFTDYEPSTPTSRTMVAEAAIAFWILARNRNRLEKFERTLPQDPTAWTDQQHTTFARFNRYKTAADRAFSNAFKNFPDGIPPEYKWTNVHDVETCELTLAGKWCEPCARYLNGGAGIQRLTFDTWKTVIVREALTPGQHAGPTGLGNLPRPAERGAEVPYSEMLEYLAGLQADAPDDKGDEHLDGDLEPTPGDHDNAPEPR